MFLSVDKVLRKAQSLIKAGHLAEAEALYKQVLLKFPKNKRAAQEYQKLKAQINSRGVSKTEPPQKKIDETINLYNEGQLRSAVDHAQVLTRQYPKAFAAWNILGAAFQGLGQFVEASKAFKKVTELNPNYAYGFNNLGVTFKEQGKLNDAIEAFKRALSLKSDYAAAYVNMGNALQEKGELGAAIENFKLAIKLEPENAETYCNLGNALQKNGEYSAGVDNYKKAIKIKPDHAVAYYNMGAALTEQGELSAAINSYEQAIKIEPNHAEAYYNMGTALTEQGKLDAAIESLKQAIKIKSGYPEANYNLGQALSKKGELDAAIDHYKEAIKVKPDYTEAYNNLGVLFTRKLDCHAATHCFKQAIKIKPNCPKAYYNLGNFLDQSGESNAAIDSYKQAIEIKPDYAEAYSNLGVIFTRKLDYRSATHCFKQAIRIKPDYPEPRINLAKQAYDVGDTENAMTMYSKILESNPGHPEATNNLIYAIPRINNSEMENSFTEICSYAQLMESPFVSERPIHNNMNDPDRCLQIGFVSGDFRNHEVTLYCFKLFSHLYQYSSLETHAYHNHFTEDAVTKELKNYFHNWNSVAHLSDNQLTSTIVKDKIDILIDLSNHTKNNRLCVFARKPAPLQVTSIGLPNTTGLSAVDYYFGRGEHPIGKQFSECYAALPVTAAYGPVEEMPPVNALPALENGFITFGSFNMVSKVTRQCIVLWSRLLREIPNSRLLFAGQIGKISQSKFEKWFCEERIELSRIIFQPRVSRNEYYRLHHKVDVLLTAFPHSGSTTIANALWMGVPSMIFSQDGDVTKTGGLVLSYAGLQDFCLKNEDDFVAKGQVLADNLTKLACIRTKLRKTFSTSEYCNPNAAAASWEAGLRKIWKRWCSGLDPEPFKLKMEDLEYLSPRQPSSGVIDD